MNGRNPGRLQDQVTVEVATRTSDGGGGFTESWAAVSAGLTSIAAEIKALDGDERIRAMQTQADVTHEVTIRYHADVKASHRLKVTTDSDRILKIVSAPMRIGRKQWLTMLCREDVEG